MTTNVHEDSAFTLENFLPYHLHTVSLLIMQLTTRRYAQELDISVAEGRVLTAVSSFGPLSTHEIAGRTRMDKAKVSRAIKYLVARGWLLRDINPTDNRLIMLTLTSEGRTIHDAVVPIITAIEREIVDAIGLESKAAFVDMLAKIEAKLDASILLSASAPASTR